jgi:hypothetical protein
VNTYARYRGHWVRIASAGGSETVRVYYADRNMAWAEEHGFAQHEMYQYEKYGPMEGPLEKTVSISELYDAHDMPDNEAFQRWREAHLNR